MADETAPLQTPPAPAAKSVSCPSCGGTVTLRAAGYTVNVACEYCSSILDVTDPTVKLITQYNEAAAELDIPLGTRGTLRGVEWEVIGYLQRSEGGSYPWEEYLLFNPYNGYRWLIANRGGWSLGEMLTLSPGVSPYGGLELEGERYKHFFADGRAQVDYVLGEFYWRVARGETVSTDDWVRPGYMLSREANAYEVSWTLSELLSRDEVRAAFPDANASRSHWPPLPHQPSPHRGFLRSAWKVALLALVLIFGVMIAFSGEKWVTAGTFAIASDGSEKSVTLGPVTFDRPYQRVEIDADVPQLENGWVDLDYALVNRATQQSYTAYGAAERYSGSDSDGPWTEGSRGNHVSIASVPRGTYDLVVDYKGNRWGSSSSYTPSSFFGTSQPDNGWMTASSQPQVTIKVNQGALYFSNMLIALLFVSIPLLWSLFRHMSFEKARIGESDFAPVESDDEDDD